MLGGQVKCPHSHSVCDACLEAWVVASRKPDLYEFLYETWATLVEHYEDEGLLEEAAKCESRANDYRELMFRWNDRQSG